MLAAAVGALTALSSGMSASYAAINTSASRNEVNPSGLNNLLRQAQQAMAQGHANVAVIYLKNAADLAPKNFNVRMELGYAFLKSGDPQSAVRELRAAREAGARTSKCCRSCSTPCWPTTKGSSYLTSTPNRATATTARSPRRRCGRAAWRSLP